MTTRTYQHPALEDPPNEPAFEHRATAASTPNPRCRWRDGRWLKPLQRMFIGLAVWILYVPNLYLVWALGPRMGGYWLRFVARIHWLLTFVGLQHHALKAIRQASPYLRTSCSSRTILRKHLEFKHQCFADVRMPVVSGRDLCSDYFERTVLPEEQAGFSKLHQENKGIIVIGYHFGHFRQAAHAMPKLFSEAKFCLVQYPETQYVQTALAPVARLVRQQRRLADQKLACEMIYLHPKFPPIELVQRLRNNEVLMLAVDGMVAGRFLDVPFLGGVIRMPCGWAELAAITGSPVVVCMECAPDRFQHETRTRQIIRCASRRSEDVRRAVEEATAILEAYVQKKPWEWHPWQRLRVIDDDEPRRYLLRSGTALNHTET